MKKYYDLQPSTRYYTIAFITSIFGIIQLNTQVNEIFLVRLYSFMNVFFAACGVISYAFLFGGFYRSYKEYKQILNKNASVVYYRGIGVLLVAIYFFNLGNDSVVSKIPLLSGILFIFLYRLIRYFIIKYKKESKNNSTTAI